MCVYVWLVVILIELVLYCFNSEQLVVEGLEIIFLMGLDWRYI